MFPSRVLWKQSKGGVLFSPHPKDRRFLEDKDGVSQHTYHSFWQYLKFSRDKMLLILLKGISAFRRTCFELGGSPVLGGEDKHEARHRACIPVLGLPLVNLRIWQDAHSPRLSFLSVKWQNQVSGSLSFFQTSISLSGISKPLASEPPMGQISVL